MKYQKGKERIKDKLVRKLGRKGEREPDLVWSGWLGLNTFIKMIIKFSFKISSVLNIKLKLDFLSTAKKTKFSWIIGLLPVRDYEQFLFTF